MQKLRSGRASGASLAPPPILCLNPPRPASRSDRWSSGSACTAPGTGSSLSEMPDFPPLSPSDRQRVTLTLCQIGFLAVPPTLGARSWLIQSRITPLPYSGSGDARLHVSSFSLLQAKRFQVLQLFLMGWGFKACY